MAVTHDDVRHVAELARLNVDEYRLDDLVGELNGILGHMDALAQVDTSEVERSSSEPANGTPVRPDSGLPLPMEAPRETFAPAMRDGFFLVPRLATHEDPAEGSS